MDPSSQDQGGDMKFTLHAWLIVLLLASGVVSAEEHQEGQAADEPTQEQPAEPAQAGESADKGAQVDSAPLGHDLIAALQADPNFSIFAEALIRSEVFDRLKAEGQPGPFTILAPTNEAFHSVGLQAGEVEQGGFDFEAVDPAELYELVRNHIVSGAVTADDFEAGGELAAISGSRFAVQSVDEGVVAAQPEEESEEGQVAGGGQAAAEAAEVPPFTIDGARIVRIAPETPEGFIYGIDAVLLPEGVAIDLEEAGQPDQEEPSDPPGGAERGEGAEMDSEDVPAGDEEAGGQD